MLSLKIEMEVINSMKIVKESIAIIISIFLLAAGINLFLGPHHVAAGGVTGIGILVEAVLKIDRSIVVLALNLLMLLFAFIFLGKEVFLKSVLGSLALPVALGIIPETMIINDRFFSVAFGSIIFAFGVSTLYWFGASSGGTTVPPLIFHKYFNLNTSVGYLLTDATIVVFNIFVFGTEAFLYAVSSIIITTFVMGYIEIGLERKKALFITSESHTEEIRDVLLNTLDLGLTVFNVEGGFTGEPKKMLLVVVKRSEYGQLIRNVKNIDQKSFIVTYNIADVHGLGFDYQPVV